MAIAFRQLVTLSATSAFPSTVFLPSDPLNGSTLIAVVACIGPDAVSEIRQSGVDWNLLYESDGPVDADENASDAVRVQIWGAFNVRGVFSQIGFDFTGGTTERGVIVAEYTGHGFEFPNPADRVVGDVGTTLAFAVGAVDTGSLTPRESVELLVGGAAIDQVATFQNQDSPFVLRSQADIGSPASGKAALLDAFTTVVFTYGVFVEHTAVGVLTSWAATLAAIRGSLQVPADPVTTPTTAEPVTENDDHTGDAVAHLIQQFKSNDKA